MAEWRVEPVEEGIRFAVRVLPRAHRNEIAGLHGEALKVRITAPPVNQAANRALVAFLAEQLGVREAQVRVLTGETSRLKLVAVVGITEDKARARLFSDAA